VNYIKTDYSYSGVVGFFAFKMVLKGDGKEFIEIKQIGLF